MSQIESLMLSDIEEKELSVELLREWWIATIQAMVEENGSEITLKFLKPHHVNAAKAAVHNLQSIDGYRPTNPGEAMAIWNGIAQWIFTGGIHRIWTDGKNTAIAETTNCELFKKWGCKEACIILCRFGGEGGGAEFLPGFVAEHTSSEGLGDDKCRWIITRKGMEPASDCDIPVEIPSISDELLRYLSQAYFGEYWVIGTKAFVASCGSERAREKLTSRMRDSGFLVGAKLKKLSNLDVLDTSSAVRIVSGLESFHQMNVAIECGPVSSEGSIIECPFSDSPIEICLQYEAFFNGVFEAISPELEFVYDRMMTKGDKPCHWRIRKRQEKAKEKSSAEDDALRTLRLRFARDEITEDEFRKKMAVLKEFKF